MNEAMASSLPVLVSNRCGCAADLSRKALNGFTFDPGNVEEIVRLMLKNFRFLIFPLSDFGSESKRIISAWGPERFANGLRDAVAGSYEKPTATHWNTRPAVVTPAFMPVSSNVPKS